ncbi:MAG: S24/S26 family peptidase [Bacilli bacterium]|nr:S24/S26 family peptidase [Bacilli bacterium]
MNNHDFKDHKITYRDIIDKQGYYIATPIGTSMLPLLRERIDTVKIVKLNRPLKRGDVILYERPNNAFLLHRIVRVKGKNESTKYILCGDNQVDLEKYVYPNQIIGVMEGYYHGEEYISTSDRSYIRYVRRRLNSIWRRKIKRFIAKAYHKIFKRQ